MTEEGKYKPMAVYPETHQRISRIANLKRRTLLDTIDIMAQFYERMGMPELDELAREVPPTPQAEK